MKLLNERTRGKHREVLINNDIELYRVCRLCPDALPFGVMSVDSSMMAFTVDL